MPHKKKLKSSRTGKEVPGAVQTKYVAFCDILGFSHAVVEDFEGTLCLYADFMRLLSSYDVFPRKVKLTAYSDAILLVCDELPPLLSAVQGVAFFAGTNDFLIRGGIAHGRYWEQHRDGHMFVVSDALIEAVRLEGQVGVPAVVLSPKIEIPVEYWVPRFANGSPFATPLLHFRGLSIANPFGLYWGTTAGIKACARKERYPEHAEKYDWYLDLLAALKADEPLVPQSALDWMLEKGIVSRVEPTRSGSDSSKAPD